MPFGGEDELIARYFRPLATHAAARGLLDDAALLPASNEDLVITTDAIVEGVHFLASDPSDTVARKALRVNLSDLAAKGAKPAGFLLTLALGDADPGFLEPFAQALGEDARNFECPLLGGDTVATPGPLTISITAFGQVPPGAMAGRAGAQIGDRIVVTGTIGDAVLGLAILQQGLEVADVADSDFLIGRYRVPQPRSGLAGAVRSHAHAAMDISDGLVGDLAKLCDASKVSAVIEAGKIPLSKAARAAVADGCELTRLITGGDDYEILASVPPDQIESFMSAAAAAGLSATEIGGIVSADRPLQVLDAAGSAMIIEHRSFSHFRT